MVTIEDIPHDVLNNVLFRNLICSKERAGRMVSLASIYSLISCSKLLSSVTEREFLWKLAYEFAFPWPMLFDTYEESYKYWKRGFESSVVNTFPESPAPFVNDDIRLKIVITDGDDRVLLFGDRTFVIGVDILDGETFTTPLSTYTMPLPMLCKAYVFITTPSNVRKLYEGSFRGDLFVTPKILRLRWVYYYPSFCLQFEKIGTVLFANIFYTCPIDHFKMDNHLVLQHWLDLLSE